jgi:hypothetical protein
VATGITSGVGFSPGVGAVPAVYPSLMTVWNAGFVCIRCHLAFLPAGPPGAGSARVAPVPQFQQMVAVLAAEQRNHPPMATAPLT